MKVAALVSDSSPASNLAANPNSAARQGFLYKAALLLVCFLFGLATACFLIV